MTRALSFLTLFLLLAACGERPPAATFLSFTESTPDGDSYPVRMLVNDKYLRIEDGDAQDGYILFDRATHTVYSVSHAGKSTLVVHARPVTLMPPKRFEQSVEREATNPPAIDDRAVVHYRLLTNRQRCFDVYAAEGLLPDALAALREYAEALAGEQARTQAGMPAAFQSDCDLADLVFLPARHLAYGFPVRQVDRQGVTRQLADYKTGVAVAKGMFELPADYRQFTPEVVGR